MGYFGVESNRATAHATVELSPAAWNEKIGEELIFDFDTKN